MARLFFLFVFVVSIGACTIPNGDTAPSSANTPRPSPAATVAAAQTPDATPEDTAGKTATLACQTVDTGEYDVYKKQTFAIDFEPFRNSCFVTSHNPEYDDPPMESKFAIYRNGKQVFAFPSQFNGVNFGCWIEAVSFQDLNDDKRTDVVVVSKCQAKMGDYNENTVYMNDGKGFTTREDANTRLGEFKTVKEVIDFVKENRSVFF
ncbi:MAG TPA: hypothetical protein VFZ49_00275 [Pyrinomonadaceae bacterium]